MVLAIDAELVQSPGLMASPVPFEHDTVLVDDQQRRRVLRVGEPARVLERRGIDRDRLGRSNRQRRASAARHVLFRHVPGDIGDLEVGRIMPHSVNVGPFIDDDESDNRDQNCERRPR